MRIPAKLLVLTTAVLCACSPAEDVRVQELPAMERSSVEARLGLPELRGPWRFAGWELEAGDTLGLEAELPGLGALWLQSQKRDSLGGLYLTSGGGRVPLHGEVRRDSVVALVALAGPGDGRYLVGSVRQDTLWLESSTLVEQGSWRGDARAAFVRSQSAVTPFRRVRGVFAAAPAVDSAALAAGSDSLPPADTGMPGLAPTAGTASSTPAAGTSQPSVGTGQPSTPRPITPAQPPRAETAPPASPPVTQTEPAESQVQEPAPQPEPEPVVEQPERPRILGVPVDRDD